MVNYIKFIQIYNNLKSKIGGKYFILSKKREIEMSSDKQSLFFSPKIISFDRLSEFITLKQKGTIKGTNLINKEEQFEIDFGNIKEINLKNGYHHVRLNKPIPNNIDFIQETYFELL